MNTITVTAHGAPNSLARALQHDPGLGIAAICILRRIVSILDEGDNLSPGGGSHSEAQHLLQTIDHNIEAALAPNTERTAHDNRNA